MDIRKLSEFALVGQTGSIRSAAAKLHIAPTTLICRIHAFEQELGVALLERQGLTEAGKQLLTQAPDILQRWQTTMKEVTAASQHAYRHLRISLPETIMPLFLGPFLEHLNRTWPQIHIDLLDGTDLSMEETLRSGEVDVFFAVMIDRQTPPDLERYDIATPYHHILLPSRHPLTNKNELRLRDLDGEQFILAPNGACACVRDFQLTNLAAGKIRYTLYDSQSTITYSKLLVSIGKGLFLSPSPIPDLPPNTASLMIRDLPYPATPCFFVHKQTGNADAVAFVHDFLAFTRDAPGMMRSMEGMRHDI
ncbi:MAG: LysR substrate-binding domain-containing protein [Aristaeellaceae bacterium]